MLLAVSSEARRLQFDSIDAGRSGIAGEGKPHGQASPKRLDSARGDEYAWRWPGNIFGKYENKNEDQIEKRKGE